MDSVDLLLLENSRGTARNVSYSHSANSDVQSNGQTQAEALLVQMLQTAIHQGRSNLRYQRQSLLNEPNQQKHKRH